MTTTAAHKHQPRWTNKERLDLLSLEDDELHGSLIDVGAGHWAWFCQHCDEHGHSDGPDPAWAWSTFLTHERWAHGEVTG